MVEILVVIKLSNPAVERDGQQAALVDPFRASHSGCSSFPR